MSGLFITFEGTEASGKSTQIELLAKHLRAAGRVVKVVREPGGTGIGEEIRHTLKHSHQNHAMTPETELLLMTASRAQLVREIIRPALQAGEIVLCDRFYDSTIAYQGHGRGLDLKIVKALTHFAVGKTRPDLTLFLKVSPAASRRRQVSRSRAAIRQRDRFEESNADFFARVAAGYRAIADAEPRRVKVINASAPIPTVARSIWKRVEPLL